MTTEIKAILIETDVEQEYNYDNTSTGRPIIVRTEYHDIREAIAAAKRSCSDVAEVRDPAGTLLFPVDCAQCRARTDCERNPLNYSMCAVGDA